MLYYRTKLVKLFKTHSTIQQFFEQFYNKKY